MSEEVELTKLLEENQLGPSNRQQIWEDKNGKKWEKLIQRVDRLTGRLEERVRSATRDIREQITLREYHEAQTQTSSAQARSKALADMPEEERQKIIQEKFKAKREKSERRAEQMRIAQMDEEQLMEESKRNEETRRMESLVAERSQLATQNVDAQRDLKAELKAEGKTPDEIKKALKSLKKSQRAEASGEEDQKEEKKFKGKRKGRPKKGALKNPVKDPETGKMVSSDDK